MKKQVGDTITARDNVTGRILWQPNIKRIAKLRSPKGGFEPTIMLVQHRNGDKELYFPYWKRTRNGKQGFANRPPMFNEEIFLELLTDAVSQGFFTRSFLRKLNRAVGTALSK